jgi:hypothetical protein
MKRRGATHLSLWYDLTMSKGPPSSPDTQKLTIAPIAQFSADLTVKKPIPILEQRGITLENLEGRLEARHFSSWGQYLSREDQNLLRSVRVGLIHTFISGEHLGWPEKNSEDLLHEVFVCLRIVKPTRAVFSPIQARLLGEELELFSFTRPHRWRSNTPESEALNVVAEPDIETLRSLLPQFLRLRSEGPSFFRRAVRFYEEGYSDIHDSVLQVIAWTIGIEAMCLEDGKWLPGRGSVPAQVAARIGDRGGAAAWGELSKDERPKASFGALLADLFNLRDQIVHGSWIPEAWKTKFGRRSLDGSPLSYADLLRETAAAALRTLLSLYLEQGGSEPH